MITACPVCILPTDSAEECPAYGACVLCGGDTGEACLCHRQLELFCCDCPEPAVLGERQCAKHAPRDEAEAYRAIQREVAEDRAAEAARERLWWEDDTGWA